MSKEFTSNTALNCKPQEEGLALRFAPDFTSAGYQLFEAPNEEVLERLIKGESGRIQSYQDKQESSCALCMESETFRVKKSENSNFLYVLDVASKDDKGAEIITQTSQVIELQKSKPKIYQVLTLVHRNNGELTRADILKQAQVSASELSSILDELNFKHILRLFESEDGKISIVTQVRLIEIVGDLLIFLNAFLTSETTVSVDDVIAKNDGCIRTDFGRDTIVFGLRHLGQETSPGVFELKMAMVKRILALQALVEKPDGYILKEFVHALKTVFDLGIPAPLEQQSQEVSPGQNLIDNYTDADLSMLRGLAVIVPGNQVRSTECTLRTSNSICDDLLFPLHPWHSLKDGQPLFLLCQDQMDKQLEILFSFKDKWLQKEIQAQMHIDPEVRAKFDQWLSKNAKAVKEKSPFAPAQMVTLFKRN